MCIPRTGRRGACSGRRRRKWGSADNAAWCGHNRQHTGRACHLIAGRVGCAVHHGEATNQSVQRAHRRLGNSHRRKRERRDCVCQRDKTIARTMPREVQSVKYVPIMSAVLFLAVTMSLISLVGGC